MPDNEYTSKFKIDITDLKKGMQQANQIMRIANSEFKAATGGMDKWGSSADGLSAKLKQLNTVHDVQKAKLEILQAEYSRVVQAEGENSKGAQDLYIKMNNLQGEIGKTESQIKTYSDRLSDVQSAQEQSASGAEQQANAFEQLKQTISEQESELSSLKNEYSNIVLQQGESSDEAQNLANEIKQLSGELVENKSKLSQAESAADGFDQSLDDVGGSAEDASGGFTIMKGALADLVADGIKAAAEAFKDLMTQASEANSNFQAQTGASAAEMEKFSESIENVYKQNFGESMQDVADAMAQVKQQTGEIDPSKLEQMTEDGIALRDTFGYDLTESMRAVKMLMDQFGLSSTEAFNLVVEGAQNGLDKNGDLLDTINEYSSYYAAQGYSADEFYNSLKNGTDEGTFSVDKLGDAMKEFGIRTKDTAKTTTEGFELLGLDADEMREKFAAGGESARDATEQTLEALYGLDDQVKQNQAGVDLFGTMWEDLGADGVQALMDVSGEAVTTSDSMKQLSDVKYDNVGSQISEIGRLFKSEIFQPIVDLIEPAVKKLGQFIIDNFSVIGPIITGVAVAFGVLAGALGIQALITGVTKAFGLLNLTMLANPIVLIVALIAGLVVAFVGLWNKSETFRNFWIGLWESIKSAASTAVDGIVKFFTETIPNAFNGIVTFFSNLPSTIVTALGNLISSIATWGSNLASKAAEIGSNFVNSFINFITDLPNKIAYGLGAVIGFVAGWAATFVLKAVEAGSNFVNGIINFIVNLPSNIANFLSIVITNVANFAKDFIKKAAQAGKNFLKNLVNGVKNLPSKIQSTLTKIISNVTKFASNFVKKAKTAAKNFLTSVANGIKSLPSKVASTFTSVISKAAKFVTNFAKKATAAAKKFTTNIVNGVKGIPGKMVSIGKNIVSGIWRGISGRAGWLLSQATNWANNFIKGIKAKFKIHSPSKVMRDEVGKQIAKGVAVGIANETKSVTGAIKNMANAAINEAKKVKNYDFSGAGSAATETLKDSINNKINDSVTAAKNLATTQLKSYDTAIKKLETARDKKVDALTKKKNKVKSKKQKNAYQKQIDATKKSYQKQIDLQKDYQKKYKEASDKAISAYTSAMKDYTEKANELIQDTIDNITSTYQKKYDNLASAQENMISKMKSFGDLYTVSSAGVMVINDITKQTESLKKYVSNLNAIKKKVPEELFSDIANMDIKEGTEYMNRLLSMGDKQLKAYTNAYVEKQRLAEEASQNLYKNDFTKVSKDYQTAIKNAFGPLTSQLNTLGQQCMQGFTSGLTSQVKNVTKDVRDIANSIINQFKSTLKIHSPSKVFAEMGGFSASGYVEGFEKSIKNLRSNLVGSMDLNSLKSKSRVNTTASNTTQVTQNFYQTNNSPKALSRLEIYRQTKNQLRFAKGV